MRAAIAARPRQGVGGRPGFGAAALRARHPRPITCDISGYCEDGPAATMKAYDFLIRCEAGLASVTGPAEGPAHDAAIRAEFAL